MNIDLSRFKVVYGDKVLNSISLSDIVFPDSVDWDATYKQPKIIEVIVINEDGNIVAIRDEAWRFQFVSIVNK